MARTCLISKLRLLHPLRTRLSISRQDIPKQQQQLQHPPTLFNVNSKSKIQQQRSLSTSKKRGFSAASSSSALVEDDEIDHDAPYDDEQSDEQSLPLRPRLRDLRQRLKSETVAPALTSFVNKRNNNDKSSTTTTSSPSPPPPQTTLHWKDALTLANEKISTLPSQPSPLTDPYGRFHNYLRLSLSERCNLRCIYCMPPEGIPLSPPPSLLSTPEILTLASTFHSLGVTKIRLTGGEPTLRRDLPHVLEGLKAVGFTESVGMTTNGVILAKHLEEYVANGLNRVNVSLDTLRPALFSRLSRRPEGYFHRVWEGLEMAAKRFSREELMTKINVVVMKGVNDDEVGDFVRLLDVFPDIDVRFIEYMPFTDNGWEMDKWVSYRDLLARVANDEDDALDLIELPSNDPNDTTKWYTTEHHRRNGGKGRIGFITSMSQPFCGTCNRLRLGADGQVKVCLFDGDSTVNLRDAVREGATRQDLEMLVWLALSKKRFMLGGNETPEGILENAKSNRPMTLIGG